MRLRVHHEIIASFDEPASLCVRSLRMSPRTYNGQYVRYWRIDVDNDCRQERSTDPFGNILHEFTIAGPVKTLTVIADGEVEVDDTAGVLQGALLDRMPLGICLRETPTTRASDEIRDFAASIRAGSDGSSLDICHRMMGALAERLTCKPAAPADLYGVADERAPAVFARGSGSPTDCAHLFIACVRSLNLPARFVTGYLWREDESRNSNDAAHAWAEVHVDGLGWVGFDATADSCPTEAYVRVATGVDQAGAAWLRSADRGGSPAKLAVTASIRRNLY